MGFALRRDVFCTASHFIFIEEVLMMVSTGVMSCDVSPVQCFSNSFVWVTHYGPEATPTKKSTGRSESSSDKTMTSPVTKKIFTIGPLEDFEKSAFFHFFCHFHLAPLG